MLIYALLVLCSFASCAMMNEYAEGVHSEDWTIFRGSPSLNGFADCDIPASPRLLWSKTLQSRTVAAPIVYGGWVYILNRKGQLYRFSPEGDSVMIHDFKSAIEASFVVDDSMLYVGRIDGHINAFSITRHRVVWDYETLGQISGSPNLIDINGKRHLLVGSYDGGMYVLNALTGELRNRYATGYYINGSAAVWGRYMLFGGCDTWLRMVDSATGMATDSLQLESYLPASPAIWGDMAYEADYKGNIYRIGLEGGKLRPLPPPSPVEREPEREQANTHHPSPDNQEEGGGMISMPTVTQDAIYMLTDERYLSCLDCQTGNLRWKKMLRGITGECSPIVAGNKVIVCTKDGHVSLFDANDGTELWHEEVGESIVASPAVVSGRFYILTARGTLMCYEEAP